MRRTKALRNTRKASEVDSSQADTGTGGDAMDDSVGEEDMHVSEGSEGQTPTPKHNDNPRHRPKASKPKRRKVLDNGY